MIMTQKEKARAYDEALVKAKKYMDDGYTVLMPDLFPELRESEDEKKVKGFIDTLRKTSGFAGNEYIGNEIADCIGWLIDWLEKQKEHQNNSDAPNESSWTGLISSSDKDKNLDEIAQDYVDGVKEYNPEPTWDLIQTAVCYGYHYREQKEQKPAEVKDPFSNANFVRGYESGYADAKR